MIPAIFGLSGTSLTPEERAFFADARPAGYVLFARNVINRQQLAALTADLRALHGRDKLLICIDQEGGRVARMKPPEWPSYPSGERFSKLWDIAPASAIAAMRANAEALGRDLAEMGISVDCWPCVDVRMAGAHDVIGDRALGEEPLRVAALARAALEGLAAAGVAGIVKHMPGHGRAMADSHRELPTVYASDAELERDITPFRTLCTAQASVMTALPRIGMTGHIVFPAWDAENPATFSKVVVQKIIRERIGFDGLLLTDDIDMQALSGPMVQRAVRAVEAGCDLVLNCWARMGDMIAIAKALPVMTEVTTQRLVTALAETQVPKACEAQVHATLINERDHLLALGSITGGVEREAVAGVGDPAWVPPGNPA